MSPEMPVRKTRGYNEEWLYVVRVEACILMVPQSLETDADHADRVCPGRNHVQERWQGPCGDVLPSLLRQEMERNPDRYAWLGKVFLSLQKALDGLSGTPDMITPWRLPGGIFVDPRMSSGWKTGIKGGRGGARDCLMLIVFAISRLKIQFILIRPSIPRENLTQLFPVGLDPDAPPNRDPDLDLDSHHLLRVNVTASYSLTLR
ncbi:hypothetical protein B0H34DRAFT_840980 [Crassisporium funariophilum]|nr:hypothetical protein B0H34DRAFT_840980 [Crassisporium funariophilum]